jgi:C4-dicarboxylate-specific signal transduction histidine kinase
VHSPVSELRLPQGSEILFRNASAWEEYKPQIVMIGAAILLLASLVTWLIIERQYRRRAEGTTRNLMTELTHVNRMATAGALSASIAHEIGQPLGAITLNAAVARTSLDAGNFDKEGLANLLADIEADSTRATEILAGVRALFRKDTTKKTAIDINKLISTVLTVAEIDLRKNSVQLRTYFANGLPPVECDAAQLQQVVLNLVVNAIDAMHSVSNRVLTIRTAQSKQHTVHVSVEDTGTGIDPSNLDRLFEPLFTTKARGMGMGLSICRSVIESYEGRIWASSTANGGSSFQFELPAGGSTPGAVAPPTPVPGSHMP